VYVCWVLYITLNLVNPAHYWCWVSWLPFFIMSTTQRTKIICHFSQSEMESK